MNRKRNVVFHENEQLSAIEMVAKLYGSMREVINEFNNLETQLTEAMNSFTSESTNEQSTFQLGVQQSFQDLSSAVELTVQAIKQEIKDYVQTRIDNGDLTGPQGPKGDTGQAGTNGQNGQDGEDGYTPVKGVDYFDGEDGQDGTSFNWCGTYDPLLPYNPYDVVQYEGSLYVATVLIPEYTYPNQDEGWELFVQRGQDGSDATVTIDSVLSDTSENPVQNKVVKAKFDELSSEIVDLSQAQIKISMPEFVDSKEEMTDQNKLYVLKSDGYIYENKEVEITTEPTANYTNKVLTSIESDGSPYNGGLGYKSGYRISSSGVEKSASGYGCTGFIPVNAGDTVRIKNWATGNGYGNVYYFTDISTIANAVTPINPDSDGVFIITVPVNRTYLRVTTQEQSEPLIVTINEEIAETAGGTTTGYDWVNTGVSYAPSDNEERISNLENAVSNSLKPLMYISPTGNDDNDGLTANTPKKTVKACLNAGATRISAKRGVYKEYFHLNNIGELEIFPTDNDQTYSVDSHEWQPIVFDVSDSLEVSNLTTYNAIKRVAYSNTSNTAFSKVFTNKTQSPIYNALGSRYNASVWLLSNDEKTVCLKLKPVLTIAECEAEINTFTYVDGYIYINANMTGVEKVVIPTNWDAGINIKNAKKVIFREVEVKFSGGYNIHILNCPHFEFYKCSSKFTLWASGIDIDNANGVLTACYATKNFDGFGVSGYGHTTFIDCVAEFNFDDGVSHHDGTKGTFIGGRYEGNGKGGNTPAYGAEVNIYGGIYKNNASFGIGYLYTPTLNPANGIVEGAVMVDNPIGLSVNVNCNVTAIYCKYSGNTTDKSINGNLTEY